MNLVAGLGLAAATGLAYSAGYEVRAFTLRDVTVPVLPAGADSIRVLHVSDIHMTPRQRKKANWLKSLANVRPDFVIATGDFLAHREAVPAVLEALAPLRELPGAFVFGSNDYYAPSAKNPARYLFKDDGTRIHGDELDWPLLRDALTNSGWANLTHTRAQFEIGGVRTELRGVDDPHLERDDYRLVAGAAAEGTQLSIGVAHAPYRRVLSAMANDGMDLIFAGHTHGGQLCVPGIGALVTNCDLDRRLAKGLHQHGSAWVHVSAGCGTNPYTPVRFSCRPEATLLTLTARS